MMLRPLLERVPTATRRRFGQISGLYKGQRRSGHKPSTTDSEALNDDSLFMRLPDDHQELP